MIQKQNIAKSFNVVVNKQLGLLHSIRDSKIVDQVRNSISEHNTHVSITIKSLFEEHTLTEFKEELNAFEDTHNVSVKISHIDSPEIKTLDIHVYRFQDFNLQKYTECKTCLYILLADDIISISSINRLKFKNNIQVIECGQVIGSNNIFEGLSSSKILKEIYKEKEHFIHNQIKLVYKILRRRNDILSGNIILNKGRELNLMSKNAKALQMEAGAIKNKFNASIRAVLSNFETRIADTFNTENTEYKSLNEEIKEFVGFNDNKEGKAITFSYPKDFLEGFKQNCLNRSKNVYESCEKSIQQSVNTIEKELLQKVKQSEEQKLDLDSIGTGQVIFSKTISKDVEMFRNEERKAEFKGKSSIFSALRTPIYALFPLIMIARFIPSSDVGAIDHSIKTFENQSVIAVSDIPDTYDKSVTKFISAIERALENGDLVNRDTGKDVFKYTLGERRSKSVEYHTIQNDNKLPLILLPVYSDREMAAEILMDNILTIQMRFNIAAEIKKVPKILGPFDKLFGPIFFGLIMLFIYYKKNSMNQHNEMTRQSETDELKETKYQEIQNFMKSSQAQAKIQIKQILRDYLDTANRKIDEHFAVLIQQEEKERLKEIKMYKSREKLFQEEINSIGISQKKIFETGKEYYKTISDSI